nr:MAG TPA: Repressor protein CI [Caudoviricetes sp.]
MYDRFKNLLMERGCKASDVAKATNIHPSTFSDWKKGKSTPKFDKLEKIASFFNVSTDYLRGATDIRNNQEILNKIDVKRGFKIPVLGKVAAGIPIEAIEEIIDWEEITPEMAKNGEYFALSIRGDSMEPKISEGDVVIVRKQPDVESGEIAIIRINGDNATCKRVIKSSDGFIFISLNPSYAPIHYSVEDIETLPIEILGKVVELRAKF